MGRTMPVIHVSDGCAFCGCDGCDECSKHSWRACDCLKFNQLVSVHVRKEDDPRYSTKHED